MRGHSHSPASAGMFCTVLYCSALCDLLMARHCGWHVDVLVLVLVPSACEEVRCDEVPWGRSRGSRRVRSTPSRVPLRSCRSTRTRTRLLRAAPIPSRPVSFLLALHSSPLESPAALSSLQPLISSATIESRGEVCTRLVMYCTLQYDRTRPDRTGQDRSPESPPENRRQTLPIERKRVVGHECDHSMQRHARAHRKRRASGIACYRPVPRRLRPFPDNLLSRN